MSLQELWIDALSGMPVLLKASDLWSLTALTQLALRSQQASFQLSEPLTEICQALPNLECLTLETGGGWSDQSLAHLRDLDARIRAEQPGSGACNVQYLDYTGREPQVKIQSLGVMNKS